MSRIDSDIPSHRDGPLTRLPSGFLIVFLLFVLLSSNIFNELYAPPVASAAAVKNPNPSIASPSWLQTPTTAAKVPNLNVMVKGKQDPTLQPIGHPQAKLPVPQTLSLTPQAQHFLSADKHFALDIAAGTVSAAQVQAAGGKIQLQVVQTEGSGGGSASGELLFGTYQLNLLDAQGQPLTTLTLAQPISVSYHLANDQASLLHQNPVVYAFWGAASPSKPATSNHSITQQKTPVRQPTTVDVRQPHVFRANIGGNGLTWSWSSRLNQSTATPSSASTMHPVTVAAVPAVSSSTVTFSTQTPEASWSTPGNFQVGMNSGSLSYAYPLNIPEGGFAPPLSLSYSSESVNGSYNPQAAAPWLGEGWDLSLGSISWQQENVTPDTTNRKENAWYINDSYGNSGQLIPPDLNASTDAPTVPAMNALPAQYIWHTAPESHSKVQEVNFNGQPCWHVWLQNGMFEEFGCTNEARQSAPDANGVMTPYRWDLNLIVDRNGNQIRVHYQRKQPSGQGIQDAVMSSVEYDDPSCHNTTFTNATAGCTSWNPKITIVFNAATKADRLTNTACSSWTNTSTRCDDPIDLSSSGGWAAPKATSVYLLNNIEIQVNGNVLHRYLFSYEQTGPSTITDPLSGLKISAKGYLDLTQIQEQGTNGTTLNAPVINMTYQNQTLHYEDLSRHAKPSTNCGPSWTHSDSAGCFLWSQSYSARYLSSLDNGRGWHEDLTWKEARSNVHGVDSGSVNDVFTCDGQESSSNLCGQADDAAWSRFVIAKRQANTNGVTSNWSYSYYLRTSWPSPPCANCNQGYMWGNLNDGDYADYYNYIFTSFASAQVTNPDNSSEIYDYASSDGIGVASDGITCYAKVTCHDAPFMNEDPGIAGQVKHEEHYDTNGNLLTVTDWSHAMNCPPAGVGHSANASGAPDDIGDTQLSSQMDRNNPVVVCDPTVTQKDDYQVDGVTDSTGYKTDNRVVHKISTDSYDTDNQGTNDTNGYDYGNLSQVDTTANDVNDLHVITGTTYYPYDNVGAGIYVTSLPAYTFTQDSSGKKYNCSASVYGNNTSPSQSPTSTNVTSNITYLNNGDCSGSAATTSHTYDASGSPLAATDANGNLGCTSGSNKYSACATYDSFDTHMLSSSNAKNQTGTYTYDSSAAGGFGQWLTKTTNANGQSTSYQYDVLGRLTAELLPGDSASPSITYTYTSTCSTTVTAPCQEIDTTTRINTAAGSSTSVSRKYYDGMGRLVETVAPGAVPLSRVPAIPSLIITYTIYDSMGNATTQSQPYAVPNSSGTPGGNGYLAPDLTQPRTVTRYDGMGRSLGTVVYSNASAIIASTSTTYSVAQGVPGFNDDTQTPFERATDVDAYNHQGITYTDGLGRVRYSQDYSGDGSTDRPYQTYRTLQSNYDTVGNVTSTYTYDQNYNRITYQTSVYDGTNKLVGWNDADSGSCTNTPMPASCSNSSDTAWKATYDNDGNQLSQTDPRGQTSYASYDSLNRLLCKGTTQASVSPCQNSTYISYFYDSYTNSSNPGVTFPVGCKAPSTSYPIGSTVAQVFSGSAGSGWRCNGYDARGQDTMDMLSVTADNTTTTQTVSKSYNNGGELQTLTYPDGEIVSYNNNDDGYFHGLTTANGNIVSSVNYTLFGQPASMIIGGAAYKGAYTTPVQINDGYDTAERPLSDSASISGTSIFSQTRTYDNTGNVLQLSTTVPKTTGGTATDNQSYCYDDQDRLVWAGNTGTPTGGDHCGLSPTGTTTPTYQQAYSYDALNRITSGSAGTVGYDPSHVHAATTLSSVPNQYASYDDMGNMTCRNVDTTSAHSCDAVTQTGATMTYDNEGQLASWQAPSGTNETDQFLYDADGQRVLQRVATTTGSTTNVTDTITFDGYTDTTITNGTTTDVTKYYSAQGQDVAMVNSQGWFTLVPDMQSGNTLVLNGNGSVKSVQLFAPYGSVRYSDGTSPTAYNYTGQRLDGTTGLLYYNSRYYDPISGRFTSTDTVETNASGSDPYAYVHDNPETKTDPTGQMMYDAATGQAGRVVNGKVQIWQYNSGIDSSETTNLTSQVFLNNVWPIYSTWTPPEIYYAAWIPPVYWTPAVTPKAPVQRKSDSVRKPDPVGCGGGLGICPNMNGNYAVQMGPFTIGIPGPFNPNDVYPGGGDDESGTGGGGSGKNDNACSFTYQTKVAVQNDKQSIGTVQVGEKVWAYNPKTKKMELQPILHVWINHDNDLVDLTITYIIKHGKTTKPTSEVIHTNKKHPFLTVEKGFLRVGLIKLGMHVVEANGQVGVISGWKVVPGVKTMYNLEVAQDHTFVVGIGQWVVHNCDPTGDPLVTVGRWMSEKEYQKMVDTGMVQEGGGGSTYAGFTSESYVKQAAAGSVYAEFDVPESSFKITNPKEGWIKFSSLNSIEGRLAKMKGLPFPELPDAKNLILLAHKLGRR